MKEPSIVFIGAERVGKAVAESLLKAGKPVQAIFTAHEDLASSIADFVSFASLEQQYPSVDIQYVRETKSDAVRNLIAQYNPDCILVASWSLLLSNSILALPRRGVVGMHYALLPARRGGAPLNWAIIDGLTETGVTLYYLDAGIDTGDIIAERRITIAPEDTVRILLREIEIIAPQLFLDHIDAILEGSAPRRPQDERCATQTARRHPKDSAIDWTISTDALHRFIRALAPPYPSAFTILGDKRLVLTGAQKEHVRGGRIRIEGYIEDYEA